MRILFFSLTLIALFLLTGCETTSTRQYAPATDNVVAIQSVAQGRGITVSLSPFSETDDLGSLNCRMMGPVDVALGRTRAEFIRDAFQSELFMAQAYSVNSNVRIQGLLTNASFSSVSPARWRLAMQISSNVHDGFVVEVDHPFRTSYSAIGACRNVADAWIPAVQALIRATVNHPEFPALIGAAG
ncbi:MAG: hypothetical protein ACXIUM_01320 [Wenzhouxiangella sp.]